MIHKNIWRRLFFSTVFVFFLAVLTSYSSHLFAQTSLPESGLLGSAFFVENTALAVPEATINSELRQTMSLAPLQSAPSLSVEHSSGQIGKPVKFVIASLNISARVEHIGLTAAGAVGVPEGTSNVSWFTSGSRPGEAGNALISGHSGIWRNTNTAVFDTLPNIKPGAIVKITDDRGVVRQFEVTELRVYGKDDSVPELFTKTGGPNLNIITCYGTWLPSLKTYDRRLVVFTRLK